MVGTTVTASDVKHIAELASIPVSSEEETTLAEGFTTTMAVVDSLKNADTSSVGPTHQVTGLENIFRDDVVDETRMLSQQQALSCAKRTADGYFVVDQVLDQGASA